MTISEVISSEVSRIIQILLGKIWWKNLHFFRYQSDLFDLVSRRIHTRTSISGQLNLRFVDLCFHTKAPFSKSSTPWYRLLAKYLRDFFHCGNSKKELPTNRNIQLILNGENFTLSFGWLFFNTSLYFVFYATLVEIWVDQTMASSEWYDGKWYFASEERKIKRKRREQK